MKITPNPPPENQETYTPLHTRLGFDQSPGHYEKNFYWGLTGHNLDKENTSPHGYYMLGEALSYAPGMKGLSILRSLKGYGKLRNSGLGRVANKLAESKYGRMGLEKIAELTKKYPKLMNDHVRFGAAAAAIDTPVAAIKAWGVGAATDSEQPPGIVSAITGSEKPMSPLEIGPFYGAMAAGGRAIGHTVRGASKWLKTTDDGFAKQLVKPEDTIPQQQLAPEDEEAYAQALTRGEPWPYGSGLDDVAHGNYQEKLLKERADEVIRAVDEEEMIRFKPNAADEAIPPPEPERLLEDLPDPEFSGAPPEAVELYGRNPKVVPDEPDWFTDIPGDSFSMPESLRSYVGKRFADRREQSLVRRAASKVTQMKRRAGLEIIGKHHAFRTIFRQDLKKELVEQGVDPEKADGLIQKAVVDNEISPSRLSTRIMAETEPPALAGMDYKEVGQVNQVFSTRVNAARNPDKVDDLDMIFGEGRPDHSSTQILREAREYYPENVLAAEQSIVDELMGLAQRMPNLSIRAQKMLQEDQFDPEVLFPGIKYDLTGGIRGLRTAVYDYIDKAAGDQKFVGTLKEIADEFPEQGLIRPAIHGVDPPPGFKEYSVPGDQVWARQDLEQVLNWDEGFAGTYWGKKLSKYSGRNMLRALATGKNLIFGIKSVPMEMLAQWGGSTQRKKGIGIFQEYAEDMTEVFPDVANREGLWQLYMDWGGSMFGLHGVTDAGKGVPLGWNKMTKAQKFHATMLQSSSFTEDLMRVAMFRKALKNGHNLDRASRMAIGGEIPDWGKAAVWEARQYLDFQQGGRAVKFIDTFIPYTNASVQYLFKSTNFMLQHPKAAASMVGAWAAYTAGNQWYNRSVNPEGYNQISSAEKDAYTIWMMPERMTPYLDGGYDPFGMVRHGYVRIPKAHPIAVFGNVLEAEMEGQMFGVDTRERGGMAKETFFRHSTDLGVPIMNAMNAYLHNEGRRGQDIYKGGAVSPEMESSFWKTTQVAKDAGEALGMSPDRVWGIYQSLGFTSNFIANSSVFGYAKINEMMNPEEKTFEEGWWVYAQQLGGLKGLISMTEGNKNVWNMTEEGKKAGGDLAKFERNLVEATKSRIMQGRDPEIMKLVQQVRPEKRREVLREIELFKASGGNKFVDEYLKHFQGMPDDQRGRAAANFLQSLPEDRRALFYSEIRKRKYETAGFVRAFIEERSRLSGKKANP